MSRPMGYAPIYGPRTSSEGSGADGYLLNRVAVLHVLRRQVVRNHRRNVVDDDMQHAVGGSGVAVGAFGGGGANGQVKSTVVAFAQGEPRKLRGSQAPDAAA